MEQYFSSVPPYVFAVFVESKAAVWAFAESFLLAIKFLPRRLFGMSVWSPRKNKKELSPLQHALLRTGVSTGPDLLNTR